MPFWYFSTIGEDADVWGEDFCGRWHALMLLRIERAKQDCPWVNPGTGDPRTRSVRRASGLLETRFYSPILPSSIVQTATAAPTLWSGTLKAKLLLQKLQALLSLGEQLKPGQPENNAVLEEPLKGLCSLPFCHHTSWCK